MFRKELSKISVTIEAETIQVNIAGKDLEMCNKYLEKILNNINIGYRTNELQSKNNDMCG